MAILNLGSINIDQRLQMTLLPLPGETVFARRSDLGLGGKGANQSIAIARAGGRVLHLGAVGKQDRWVLDELRRSGVDLRHVHLRAGPTGQAIVLIGDDGENSIVLLPGSNITLERSEIVAAVDAMTAGDWLLFQNETNGLGIAADLARRGGLSVAYAAAPFLPELVIPLLDKTDLLALNAIEFAQLEASGARLPQDLSLLVTHGAAGATFRKGGVTQRIAAFPATSLDTTGAGDTFLGAFLARLDEGDSVARALRFASAAAALQVGCAGSAEAIPQTTEVQALLDAHPSIVAAPLGTT